jgi:ferredoxin, 2Fe-2S
MAKISVVRRTGESLTIVAEVGRSLMEAIRDAGIDEIQGICGGCCSCATCHVHVEAHRLSELPAMTDDENDLLSSSAFRDATSRLACQIRMSGSLDGLRVTIAKAD